MCGFLLRIGVALPRNNNKQHTVRKSNTRLIRMVNDISEVDSVAPDFWRLRFQSRRLKEI